MRKDRWDGKYIKPKDSVHAIVPYLFERRHESEVYINQDLDFTKLKKWVDEKNKSLDYKMTYFHAMAAVVSKTVYSRPLLNRFVQGHRIYERKYFSISFVAKDKLKDKAEEKIIVLKVDPSYNATILGDKMVNCISRTRKSGTNSLDQTLKIITRLPRWLMKIFVRFVKCLDYYGKIPKSFAKGDSNYSSVLFSNLGSIKCDPVYHHLNDYGTNSIVFVIGTVKNENNKDTLTVGLTLDERIADGFYFAKSLKLMQYIMNNPELLDEEFGKEVNYEEN